MKIKNVKNFKNRLKTVYLYLPKLVVTGRRDSTLFVVVNDTNKTTKFCWPRLRTALYLSSVVVDKVVVIPNA